MPQTVAPLSARLADHTQQLILASALELLERAPVSELTVRAVAGRSGMSERTVFRYFATRDDFLDAVAGAVTARLDLPPSPATLDELLRFPDVLYRRFESTAALTRAALHTELFARMRNAQAKQRWVAVRSIVDAHAPRRPEAEREIAAANIRYHLSATTWHYYRFYFGFSLERTIDCGFTAVRQAIEGLGPVKVQR
jgi:AcrR family transcriptional regulator